MMTVPVNVRIPIDASADPRDEVILCETALRGAGWWQKCDRRERWPLTTIEAAEILRLAGQFDIDEVRLADLIARKLIPAPGVGESGYEWSARDLLFAVQILELRNQWRGTPSDHDGKKHPCQVIAEHAAAAGRLAEILVDDQGVRYDARHLLASMARCETSEGRAKILTLLLAVLEIDHGVRI